MKIFFLTFFFIFCIIAVNAQNGSADVSNTDKTEESIVDKINRSEPGKGKVKIIQDNSITERLGRPGKNVVVNKKTSVKVIEMSGWRIQVFSGNNQRVSKNEAFMKEADIKSVFPDMSTYVTYTAPFWRLKVGDFQTFQDARNILLELRRSFPSYGREMSVVKDRIKVIQD